MVTLQSASDYSCTTVVFYKDKFLFLAFVIFLYKVFMYFVLLKKQYTFSAHIKILLGIKAMMLSGNPNIFYPRPFFDNLVFFMVVVTSETTSTIIAKATAPKLGNSDFHSHLVHITTTHLY